ncbi:MAG: carboxypeptidase regulatory-like domain-containing protein [Patescibacteria group bacterium]|nr:carboxypeptidase regulatory-like domain-containing protein [Patescibacteria group bacterium]
MTTRLKKHLQRFNAISLMVVMVFSVFANKVSGASIPSVTASLSNHTKSAPANHTYKFQTPSGVDSPADTITIDLSSWATGAVSSADIDLLHGPVTGLENVNTVSALPGINTWGASFAGGILTLTPPINALPGTIAPNDIVNVYIGTNAVGGTNQLTNPATAGSYPITIGGGFGDIAYFAQAIMNSGSVSIDAQVGTTLQITNINPSSVLASSGAFNMTITGFGFVANSVGQISGADRPTIFVGSTELIVSILASDVLTAGTKQITVYNPTPGITSNQLPLTISSGVTGGGTADTTPPVILNPQAINITQTSARIIWDTDEAATSIVNYGLTNSYGETVSNGSLVISHGIDLTGLSPSTTYHFRVQSADQYGNNAVSADYTFTTLPWPPLQIYNVTSTSIADTSAIIVWDTNRPANSRVEYGLTTSLGSFINQSAFVSNHATPLSALTPNTSYFYRVISYDVNGIGATSTIYTFTTTGDVTPPTNITLNAEPGDTVVYLSWTQPPEPDFAGVRLIQKLGGFPTGPFDGTLVYDGLATTTIDTGLTNGTTYYYGAYPYDTNGNFASGALDDATPFADIIPPTPTSTTTTPPLPPTPTTTTTTPPLPPGPTVTTTPTVPPTATSTPTTPTTIQITPIYYGANGTLLLEPDTQGVRGVIASETVFVRVPTVNIGEQAQSVTINVAGQLYSLTLSSDGTEFTGTFPAPASGVFLADVKVTTVSGASAEKSDDFSVQDPGEVIEARIISGTTPIPNATVTLYQVIDGLSTIWNGAPYGQPNPTTSDDEGKFVFRVPNGEYYVEVGKVGYRPQRSTVTNIERNVFGDKIKLIYIPEPLFITFCKVDCSKISYELYLVNPDGSVSYSNSGAGSTLDQGSGTVLYSFGNSEVLIQADESDCEHVKFSLVGLNTSINQTAHVKVFYEGELNRDAVIFSDTQQSYGQTITLNLADDETLCEEEVEEVIQIETIPEKIEFTALTSLDIIREPEIITATNDFIIPTVTLVSLINLGSALSLFNLLAYLQYLFAQPILLFGRLRKRRYGVVYNSLNKQPIEMAVIRLLHAETGLVVQTKVTDKQGRYLFNVKEGDYILEVVKPEYDFPTQYLANKKADSVYPDLYHGESISLKEDGIIALNVPLDPNKPVEAPRKVIYRRFLKRVQHGIAISGIILAGISLVISPSWFIAAVLIIQVGFYFLFRQLALPAKSQSWGKIFDEDTKKPISDAVVRIFDKQFNKLLETQLSSRKGSYGFFAEHNVYYITIEKEGYQKYTSKDLDLGSQEDTTIDLNVALKRISPPKK